MNIWALSKDPKIKQLLITLEVQLGGTNFIIEEDSTVGDKAVFLHHPSEPEVRAFIHVMGQRSGRYSIHLEYYNRLTNGESEEVFENLKIQSIVEILAVHFDIASPEYIPGKRTQSA